MEITNLLRAALEAAEAKVLIITSAIRRHGKREERTEYLPVFNKCSVAPHVLLSCPDELDGLDNVQRIRDVGARLEDVDQGVQARSLPIRSSLAASAIRGVPVSSLPSRSTVVAELLQDRLPVRVRVTTELLLRHVIRRSGERRNFTLGDLRSTLAPVMTTSCLLFHAAHQLWVVWEGVAPTLREQVTNRCQLSQQRKLQPSCNPGFWASDIA